MIERFDITDGVVGMLTPHEVAQDWGILEPRIAQLLEEDFSGNLFTPAHILAGLIEGLYQCWIVLKGKEFNSLFITQIQLYPKVKVLAVPFAIGKPGLRTAKEIAEHMKQVARSKGCAYIRASGRRGWARLVEGEWLSATDDFCEV